MRALSMTAFRALVVKVLHGVNDRASVDGGLYA